MPRLNTPIWSPERPALALANALQGDPEAALNSLISPDKLSPSQHRDLVERWFGPGESAAKSIARFFTNPLTIGALALVVKWPAPTMAAIRPVVGMLKDFDRHTPGWMAKLLGELENFAGTGVDDALMWSTRQRAAQSYKYVKPHGDALAKFSQAVQQEMPTTSQQLAMGYVADMEQAGALENTAKRINEALEHLGVSRRIKPEQLMPKQPLPSAARELIDTTREQTLVPLQDLHRELDEAGLTKEMQRDMVSQSVALRQKVSLADPKLRGKLRKAALARGATGAPTEYDNLYFPHVVIRTPLEQQQAYNSMMIELGEGTQSARAKAAQTVAGAGHVTSPHLIKRHWEALPDPEQMKRLAEGGYVDKDVADAISLIYDRSREFGVGELPGRYDLRYTNAVQHYADSMIRAHTWRMPNLPESPYAAGFGKFMQDRAIQLTNSPNFTDQRLGQMLADTTMPALLGRSNVQQYMRNLTANGFKKWTANFLERPAVKQIIGEDAHKWLMDTLHYGTGTVSWHHAGGKLASWFYLSTLGFNPATAAQNLMQTAITTGAMVKPGFLVDSLQKVAKGYPELLALQRQGLDEHEALLKVFPEFGRQFLEVEPRHVDMIRNAAQAGADILPVGGAQGFKGLGRKFTDAGLSMFSLTERFNHLVAFYAGHGQAVAEGLSGKEAGAIGAKLTKLAQAWSGPHSIPTGIQTWSPVMRQFLTFPLKTAGFLAASAGGGVGLGPGGMFNPGTLGRAIVGSMAAYEGAKGLFDIDLQNSLLFGAVAQPRERGPLAPLPVVPPAVAVGAAAVYDLAKGTTEETQKVLPLLVPGGVEASRLLPMVGDQISSGLGQGVARAVGRPYANYETPDANGKVPVYSADGNYVGHFSPLELFRRGMGLGSDVAQNEAELSKYLARQRDEIRNYRRQYIVAKAGHDEDEAHRIDLEFQQKFQIGPMTIRAQDQKAYETRQQTARIQRQFKSIPAQARPLYNTMLNNVLSQITPQLVGSDPGLQF